MSDNENSRSDASAEPNEPKHPHHEQLPLLGSDAWVPHAAPAPEPAREDIPLWLRPTQPDAAPVAPAFEAAEEPAAPRAEHPAAEPPQQADAAPVAPVAEPVGDASSDDSSGRSLDVAAEATDPDDAEATDADRADEDDSDDAEATDTDRADEGDVDSDRAAAPEAEDADAATEVDESMWPQDDPNFRPFAGLTPERPRDDQGADESGESAGGADALPAAALGSGAVAPLIDRVRPPREPYVSRRAILFGLLGVLAVALVAGGIVWYALASRITVPDLVGTTVGVAQVDATRQGLVVTVGQNRFSSYPKGQVLEQSPAAGTLVRRGAPVELVVSAGTELFSLPDVTGSSLAVAKGQLQERGLTVETFTQPSQEPSGTVISMLPGPNTPVRTGDVVRLTVSSQTSEGSLKAYQLAGRVFVLDPAPAASGTNDISLEITRRLQALLEASDAKVVSARTAADSTSSQAARIKRAQSVAANALVGFSVAPSGVGGMQVQRAETTNIAQAAESQQLEADVVKALTAAGYEAKSGSLTKDPVLSATSAASVRVVLGSATSKKDKGAFRDPKWADGVAQAIYQALGQRYGSK